MRDAVAIVPPVAWLAVWNRNIDTAGSSNKKAERGTADDNEEEDDDTEQERDRSGVLYSRIYNAGPTADMPTATADSIDDRTQRDLLSRRIGLAQGLIDFTR